MISTGSGSSRTEGLGRWTEESHRGVDLNGCGETGVVNGGERRPFLFRAVRRRRTLTGSRRVVGVGPGRGVGPKTNGVKGWREGGEEEEERGGRGGDRIGRQGREKWVEGERGRIVEGHRSFGGEVVVYGPGRPGNEIPHEVRAGPVSWVSECGRTRFPGNGTPRGSGKDPSLTRVSGCGDGTSSPDGCRGGRRPDDWHWTCSVYGWFSE